jgi:hypothetical protein
MVVLSTLSKLLFFLVKKEKGGKLRKIGNLKKKGNLKKRGNIKKKVECLTY